MHTKANRSRHKTCVLGEYCEKTRKCPFHILPLHSRFPVHFIKTNSLWICKKNFNRNKNNGRLVGQYLLYIVTKVYQKLLSGTSLNSQLNFCRLCSLSQTISLLLINSWNLSNAPTDLFVTSCHKHDLVCLLPNENKLICEIMFQIRKYFYVVFF